MSSPVVLSIQSITVKLEQLFYLYAILLKLGLRGLEVRPRQFVESIHVITISEGIAISLLQPMNICLLASYSAIWSRLPLPTPLLYYALQQGQGASESCSMHELTWQTMLVVSVKQSAILVYMRKSRCIKQLSLTCGWAVPGRFEPSLSRKAAHEEKRLVGKDLVQSPAQNALTLSKRPKHIVVCWQEKKIKDLLRSLGSFAPERSTVTVVAKEKPEV